MAARRIRGVRLTREERLKDKTSHHLESILSFDLWGPLDFETSFIFDRVEKPQQTGGTPVLPNDYKVTVGLGFDI